MLPKEIQTADNLLEPVSYGFCHCRCGQLAPIAKMTSRRLGHVKGQPIRFISGHNGRGQLPLEHEVVCANKMEVYPCPRQGEPFTVRGRAARTKALRNCVYCSPECRAVARRANYSASVKARWTDPAYRAGQAAAMTAHWADPAARERMVAAMIVQWEDQENRAMRVEAMRNGDKWLGDDAVGYFARHDRLRRYLGSASAQRCVDCDQQADDWSLNGSVPPERLRADAIGNAKGLPFSVGDDTEYSARCRRCHNRLDKHTASAVVVPARKPLQKIAHLVAQGDIGRALQVARPW
jgi:hypothetical protein